MESNRFQANLSSRAAELFTLYLRPVDMGPMPEDPFWKAHYKAMKSANKYWDLLKEQQKRCYITPALYGITDIIGMGAVKVNCLPDSVDPLLNNLPQVVGKTISGEMREEAFDIKNAGEAIAAMLPKTSFIFGPGGPSGPAEDFAWSISDLVISARQRRPLNIHDIEEENLKNIHWSILNEALAETKDQPLLIALAAIIEKLVIVGTPSIRLPIRNLEILEGLMRELIQSREFQTYGERRDRLSDPKSWRKAEPLSQLQKARDRCLSRWKELQAHPIRGFAARLGAGVGRSLISKLPLLSAALEAIDFAEYQPKIYVLPKELPRIN